MCREGIPPNVKETNKMRTTAIALLTLASFGATFAVAQTPADNTTTTKTKKAKKHHSKKKTADQTTAPAPAK